MCTLDEFRSFFLAKAYDVVGNGTFRKHMAKCKDTGDAWAVTMSNQIQAVSAHIREVQTTVNAMPKSQNRLPDICKEVMMSAQPPIKLHAGCATCTITSRRCTKCLDLSRTHKGQQDLHVDIRFCTFFMLLWYTNKLEYIIRSFVRTWLDARQGDDTYKSLCNALKDEQEDTIVKMHRLFLQAKEHVTRTLDRYAKAQVFEPVLTMAAGQPPATA